MNNSEEFDTNDNSSDGLFILPMAAAALLIAKYKVVIANEASVVNPDLPFQKMTGRQWMEVNLWNKREVLGQLAYVS